MSHMVNDEAIVQLIEKLVKTPSPTGNTETIIAWVKNYLEKLGVQITHTRKGAVMATVEGKDASQQRFLTAHVDTLGAMVKEIKSDGRLKLTKIGGFPWNMAEGEYCEIETASGKRYSGTILMHQTAVHVYREAGDAKRNDENIEVRIDEKVDNEDETRALGIEVGDFVSFDPRFQATPSGFVKSRHLDDKASAAILLHLLEKIKDEGIELPYTTHFFISNNEEIGYGGNSNIPEETREYLAVDMGALGDGQQSDEYTVSICAKDSSGPYHAGMRKHLVELAKENDIGYKVDIYPYYQSDASAAVHAGYDVIHGLIGPGVESSHAYERTHRDSLLFTGDLVYHYLLSEMV